ncbi:MAG TPA: protein kinase [Polyangiaceae bacterium LLY-WYZ-15_(1-7)]|nr:serine/threonine protein kinase [Myxococcales bacterium]MAT27511.1 serine/threonine protein kinase [Sandaracinus sp.]HJK95219.1 protein kinase [Polyangiaceae bacterium LLY-WYZ-15_(1-7)]MBJ71573.1 serine/threonine protein kinase [Sandaracinus sp.]HJL01936.1 protein kinase [Polyangiaceae bacterium LLY-WYZ-15_(1-7)]
MRSGPKLALGERFADRYRILELLGVGGMGAVYEAEDEQVGERVALKLLAPTDEVDELARSRFRREVRLARRISHPNVVRIHDLGTHEGVWYLSMALVRGTDLRRLLRRTGPMDPSRAAALVRDVAGALDAVHAAGVVHRDLKPANVLLEEGGRVVLTDFGVARVSESCANTRSGLVGTPVYMAPEQVLGHPLDARTDLYSLGLILYELLTGEVPFVAETAIATALARVQHDPPDPRSKRADLPDELGRLVLRCLARAPEGRPASAAEVHEALAPFAGEVGAVPPMVGAESLFSVPTVPLRDRALAILPFRYHGPPEDAFLGRALADELIDLLARTRGLRVLSSGATEAFRDDRDPRVVGRQLDVDAVVDGTVQRSGARVRVVARLCDAATGAQLWSERFDGQLGDVFELQDKVGRRVAEALRVGLTTESHRGSAPGEAVEAYLKARGRLAEMQFRGAGGAVALLEDALDAAPEFQPAMSAHAMACLRAWFIPGLEDGRDWEAAARASVRRAVTRAGALAESHLAAAMLAGQDGDFRQAAEALERALAIAPTCAEAHEYLGRLQMESGRGEEGAAHLRMALDLDPRLARAFAELARFHALGGRWPAFEAALEALGERLGEAASPTLQTRLRGAVWRGDADEVRAALALLEDAERPDRRMMRRYGEAALDAAEGQAFRGELGALVAESENARFRAFAHQLGAEIAALHGAEEAAREHVRAAAAGALVDLDWLRRCPLLGALRERGELAEAEAQVAQRAFAIWR